MAANQSNDVDYLSDSDDDIRSNSSSESLRPTSALLSKLLPFKKRTASDLGTRSEKRLKPTILPKIFVTLPVTGREKKVVEDINNVIHRCEPGFFNLGNTCYLNAALQCLLHCDSFVRQIKDHGAHLNGTGHKQFCVLDQLHKLVDQYFDDKSPETMNPAVFVQNIRRMCPLFVPKQQQDADEFIQLLFQAIDNIECNGCPDAPFKEQKYPDEIGLILRDSAIGYMKTTITCSSCQFSSTTRAPFTKLSIGTEEFKTLEDSLGGLMKEEILEGQNAYMCNNCNTLSAAVIKKQIDDTPNVLIIQLNRFGGNGKNDDFVEYPRVLNLHPYSSDDIVAEKYELVSSLTHHGPSMGFGHYTADVKCFDGHWCRTDDDNRSKITPSMAYGNKAYMLFYQKRTPLWECEEFEEALELSGFVRNNANGEERGRIGTDGSSVGSSWMERVESIHVGSTSSDEGGGETRVGGQIRRPLGSSRPPQIFTAPRPQGTKSNRAPHAQTGWEEHLCPGSVYSAAKDVEQCLSVPCTVFKESKRGEPMVPENQIDTQCRCQCCVGKPMCLFTHQGETVKTGCLCQRLEKPWVVVQTSDPNEDVVADCVETSWIQQHGLEKGILRKRSASNVLCIPELPCATAGHMLRYCTSFHSTSCRLRTYADICAERKDCTTDFVPVSRLRNSFDWSIVQSKFADGERMELTSVSVIKDSSPFSFSFVLAFIADWLSTQGLGAACDFLLVVALSIGEGGAQIGRYATGNFRVSESL
ncbi:unnamed protein product [Agarophyton chilense]